VPVLAATATRVVGAGGDGALAISRPATRAAATMATAPTITAIPGAIDPWRIRSGGTSNPTPGGYQCQVPTPAA
jgi:hypothetical protein